jgi:hypothetical protein
MVQADDIDTSTNEDTQDTEVELEEIEVSLEDITDDDTEEAEEPKDEDTDTEPEELEEESEEDEATEEDAEADTEEAELSDEDKQKAFNREMAERRIQEKRQRELDQKQQQQEYLTQAEDEKDLVLRQLQVDAYNNKVEGNSNKLTNAYEKAVKDFNILNSSDPNIKAEVDAALDAFQAQHVTIDAYGNPIDVRGDLYETLKNKSESITRLTGIREKQQKDSKNKEKSKTITTPSKAPREPKVDPELAAFEEEASKW